MADMTVIIDILGHQVWIGNGRRFHNDTCREVLDNPNNHLVQVSEDSAKAEGYTPCLRCGG